MQPSKIEISDRNPSAYSGRTPKGVRVETHLAKASPGPARGRFPAAPNSKTALSKTALTKAHMMTKDRSTYMKAYRTGYKKRVRIVKVTLDNTGYANLERVAKAEGKRPATIALEFIEAGLSGDQRMPRQMTAELTALRHLVRSVANSMNQMAKHSNTVRAVIDKHAVFDELKKLERHILDYTSGKLKDAHARALDVT